jgi:hypothetical protein
VSAAFTHVDTAVNGAHHRNRVMPLADFRPPREARDVFATYFRFTPELAEYTATNPHVPPEKRPSVKWYRGPVFASFLPADFDRADDPDLARADAIRIVRTLEARHDVPPAATRSYFSGNKGFSLEIPGALFGGFAPATDVPERFKRLAPILFAECRTLDTSIYESVRLWRCPNFRHGISGLCKIRLTLGELECLSLDGIRALAASPRSFPADVPDDDWFPRVGLADAWAATALPERGHEPADVGADEASRPLTSGQYRELLELMTPYWFAGQKHTAALGLAGWLAVAGVPESLAEKLFRALSLEDRKPDDRLRCLRDSYQRRRLGLAVAGPSRLREYVTDEDMETLERLLGSTGALCPAILVGRLRVSRPRRLRVREATHA